MFPGGKIMRRAFVTTVLLASVLAGSLSAQDRKRVAVMNFDYATVYSGVSGIFGSNVDVGKGIADMLVDRLVRDGTYSVIERKELDKLLTEQNFSNSNRADPASAAKIGKLLGVSAIIVGSITQFGRDDKKTSVGGGAIGGITGRFGVGGISKSESKAVVEVTARMVSVDTGEILAVAEGKGESSRGGTGLLGAGGGGGGAGGGGMDMSSKNFGATILGEATNKAVTMMAMDFDSSAAKIPTVVIPVDGLVADVNGATVVLNVGTSVGLKAGQVLQVVRTGREIKDPATGKVLRRTETPVGSVTITSADAGSSEGTFSGNESVQVGDHVKR
jgi:curli biogenesis system outer membrane secretion channel CsgG